MRTAARRLAVAHPVAAAGGGALVRALAQRIEPSGTLVQVPTLPGTAHERRCRCRCRRSRRLLAEAELHSGPPPHAAPIGFLPQLPLMQLLGARQSASLVQMVSSGPSCRS
jgi:hypothetical protein